MASGSHYSLLTEDDLNPHTPGHTLPPLDDTILTCPVTLSALTPAQPALPTASSASFPKIADPPRFKGKTQDLTVEQWLQKLGIWFWYQNIVKDEDKITIALLFLEGGAQSYMDDYAKKAAEGDHLGTWDVFVDWLRSGY